MFLSWVVRLRSEELEHGRFVGQVEVVRTGEVVTVRTLEELAATLRDAAKGMSVIPLENT